MRVVIALGGNAIARRGESLDADAQRLRVREAAGAVADIARGNELVVTHGNGPQVGLLALQSQASPDVAPYPLDVLGAETEGMIGYLIEQELASIFPSAEVATLLTQVEVDPEDPAFRAPSASRRVSRPVRTKRMSPASTDTSWRSSAAESSAALIRSPGSR